MEIAGIVVEYNPYHNGHRYLTESLRSQGATHIVAVMSGHLVQRAEPAFFSKWARAEAALKNGVDLVLELPSVYASASAERFAGAAVSLLAGTGCVDVLGFGSECGDAVGLQAAARACLDNAVEPLIREELRHGVSYPTARMRAVRRLTGDDAAGLLSSPNNTLAVEYLKAVFRLRSDMKVFTVKRAGAEHDSAESRNGYASASAIRSMFRKSAEEAVPFVPSSAWEIYHRELENGMAPSSMKRLERAALYRLRTMSLSELERLPDVSEGLGSRLSRAARNAGTLEELFDSAKTKRYAHSRLRRIALCALLGVEKSDFTPPPYLRILGMNARGREIAARMKQTAQLPYGTSFAALAKAGPRIAELELRAGELFSLGLARPLVYGQDFTHPPVLLEE